MGKLKELLTSKLAIKIYALTTIWCIVLIAMMGGISQEVIFMFTNSVEALGLTEGAEVAGYTADDINGVISANQTEWCLDYLNKEVIDGNITEYNRSS